MAKSPPNIGDCPTLDYLIDCAVEEALKRAKEGFAILGYCLSPEGEELWRRDFRDTAISRVESERKWRERCES